MPMISVYTLYSVVNTPADNIWLADFLHDRSQCVLYGGVTSSLSLVLSGIIQGSILGPTLFTGGINDLPSQLETL